MEGKGNLKKRRLFGVVRFILWDEDVGEVGSMIEWNTGELSTTMKSECGVYSGKNVILKNLEVGGQPLDITA